VPGSRPVWAVGYTTLSKDKRHRLHGAAMLFPHSCIFPIQKLADIGTTSVPSRVTKSVTRMKTESQVPIGGNASVDYTRVSERSAVIKWTRDGISLCCLEVCRSGKKGIYFATSNSMNSMNSCPNQATYSYRYTDTS
jgi:hypothetical protein